MALNCIVDDSALLAGLADDPEKDLKGWVRDGSINLFVPLYTLTKLSQLKASRQSSGIPAHKALEWLDQITSLTERKARGRVELQGPEHQYESWVEVEKYKLPDTPLTRDNLAGLTDDLGERLCMDTPYTNDTALGDASDSESSAGCGPDMTEATIVDGNGRAPKGNMNGHAAAGGVPEDVRPLLNFVVWRTNHNDSTLAGSSNYILVTDDARTQSLTQKFGVRAKLLPELNRIVRKAAVSRETNSDDAPDADAGATVDEAEAEAVDDDVIVFDPLKRPGSSRGKRLSADMMDPHHFGRRTNVAASPTLSSPSVNGNARNRGGFRGDATGHAYRGRGQRGGFHPRGAMVGGEARGQPLPQSPGKPKRIDPNSYVRPSVARGGRGGGGKKLFDPNG